MRDRTISRPRLLEIGSLVSGGFKCDDAMVSAAQTAGEGGKREK